VVGEVYYNRCGMSCKMNNKEHSVIGVIREFLETHLSRLVRLPTSILKEKGCNIWAVFSYVSHLIDLLKKLQNVIAHLNSLNIHQNDKITGDTMIRQRSNVRKKSGIQSGQRGPVSVFS
jgi:hypothetical protein